MPFRNLTTLFSYLCVTFLLLSSPKCFLCLNDTTTKTTDQEDNFEPNIPPEFKVQGSYLQLIEI